jgi:predicted RNA binding protein YcfA (HicA-like mRNA interferase family)
VGIKYQYALNTHPILTVNLHRAYKMRMKARDIIRLLEADGWFEARSKGSHRQFKHPTKAGLVTVPVHGANDVPLPVLASIERQSGVKLRRL